MSEIVPEGIDAALIAQAESLHGAHPVVECHTDYALDVRRRRAAGEASPLADDYLTRLRAGGVDVQVLAVGGDVPAAYDCAGGPAACARLLIEDARAEADAANGLRIVLSAADLDEALAAHQVALILHFEGLAPVLEDGPDGAIPALHAFHELGLRSVQLTWNGPNAVADGVGVASPRRLGSTAQPLIRELEALGIAIDVAHLAEPAFWDLMVMIHRPVICSHANARALCDHRRNLTDDQIQAIAMSGGFVGVCFVGDFIDEHEPTLDRLVDHVDHIAALVGTECVAVGPDYVAFAPDLMIGPGEDGLLGPDGLQRVETLPFFTAGLLSRGYSEEDAARILGGNALRVLRDLLPSRASPGR
jgi:membrane dipeptidase